jgi:hypothetical protein
MQSSRKSHLRILNLAFARNPVILVETNQLRKIMKPFQRILIVPIAALTLSLAATTAAHGQDGKNEATMSTLGKRAVYKHVAAIRAKSSDENRIVVLAARQRITAEMVKSVK